MAKDAVSHNGVRQPGQADTELSAAALFALLWGALADLLGTATTAVLLRRASKLAAPDTPELAELAIVRGSPEYHYRLPSAWNERTEHTPRALRRLVQELLPLLVELTGPLVVRHLAQVPELQRRLIPLQEDEP